MIELFQLAWSPFCIVQRRILEYSGAPFKLTEVSSGDRTEIWRVSKQRYYQVPILRDGRNVVFEVEDTSQVIAKYLDDKLQLGLFPRSWEGVQDILWAYIEDSLEGIGFKLNDIYWEEFVPRADRLAFMRHKERRFGRGCLQQWKKQQKELVAELAHRLIPFEQMLLEKQFLLEDRPRFVDFDLFGILGNFLYSGRYKLPKEHTRLRGWYARMSSIQLPVSAQEKQKG